VYRKVFVVRRKRKYISLLLNNYDVLSNTKSVVIIVSKLRYPLQSADGDVRLSVDASSVTYNGRTLLQEQQGANSFDHVGSLLANIKLKD
jgi:hypothetical protein